jgi:hypothetical protein
MAGPSLPRAAASRLANGAAAAPAPSLAPADGDEVEEVLGGFAAEGRGDVGTSIRRLVGLDASKLPGIFEKSPIDRLDAPIDHGSTP